MTRTHWIIVAFLGLAGGAGGVAIWSDSSPDATATAVSAGQSSVVEEAPSEIAIGSDDPALEEAEPEPQEQEVVPELAMDTLRIEPDGTGIIAGRAAPGVVVVVSVNDEPVAEVEADAAGAFFSFLELPPSEEARILTLSTGPEEPLQVSAGPFFIAPTPVVAPVVVTADAVPLTPEADLPAQGTLDEAADVTIATSLTTDEVTLPVVIEEPTVVELSVAVAPDEGVGTQLTAPVAEAAPEVVASTVDVEPVDVAEAETAAADVSDAAPPLDLSVPALGRTEETPPEAQDTAAVPDVVAIAPSGSFSAEIDQPVAPTVTSQAETEVPVGVTESAALVAPAPEAVPADAPQPDVVAEVAVPGTPQAAALGATPAVLVADEDGVRVVQPALAAGADAEVLRTVALDAITYDPAGDVILAGRASGGGVVRVYLNNQLLTEVLVAQDGTWTSGLEGIDAGVYNLRVDQVGTEGAVSSRIETPFQREERAVIASVLAEDLEQEGAQVAVRTVQPGNTLWGISQERYGDGVLYVQVFEANRDLIRDPNLIYPGQILRIPEGETE